MRVLIACEYSGTVRDAFLALGHDAISCDLLPSDKPGPHYQGDVFDIIRDGYDLMIAHPPCTDLSVSGARHFKQKIADGRQQRGIDFVKSLMDAPIHKICIENPVSVISSYLRPPDQIIQPYFFGDEFQKTTCLWLKNLPKLFHNSKPDLFNSEVTHVSRGEMVIFKSGKSMPKWYADLPSTKSEANRKLRNKTFQGIANAMAKQWGGQV